MITYDDIQVAFREKVKSIQCPHCEIEYTDFAVDWGDAYCEGRRDLMDEQGWQERDGPYKLKCELCGKRAWLNYFAMSVKSAEAPPKPVVLKRGR